MKKLVLLGAGHAHVHVLSTLAAQPLPGVQVTLVAPFPRQLYSGMVPGFVAGHYTLDECVIQLEPLLKGTDITWLPRSVTSLDASANSVTLNDGSTLDFDWLSVNTGPVQDRKKTEALLPGAREHGLFVRPIESFGALWPQVLAMAPPQPLRLAVIGGGAAGIELCMAVRQRLPKASVTLINGSGELAASYPEKVRQRVRQALKERGIVVLFERASRIQAGEVTLENGATLVCDVPLIATGAQAPAWLQGSGLALDEQGFIAVDAFQRSTSHDRIFAVGDVSTRIDQPLPRSGVYAVRAGPALLTNLTAVLAGVPPVPHMPPKNTLNLLSCGDHYAIATWGDYSAQGRWVWWLKDWIDRGFIKRYSRT